ncbi:PREDICTED: uncharacterized protein LOC108561488 [Nicrophorus vespilloides]|uniref:Uncharacterized protein LOC108561488 n=1 Tax=Nicrophorus vespilloides TaxID=110193 RepID=A0ABM1MK36_NICVS|nr:PREDICTED: uncharacterized protein LOC108561488 [Nicrophorus vespilloides]
MSDKGKKMDEKPKIRKAPQVRQTLTSVYRMVKANPSLMYQKQRKDELKLDKISLPPSVSMEYVPIQVKERRFSESQNSLIKRYSDCKSLNRTHQSTIKPNINKGQAKPMSNNILKEKPKTAALQNDNFKKPSIHENHPKNKMIKPSCRSLSAQHFNRKKLIAKSTIEEKLSKADVTQSMEGNIDKAGLLLASECSPIKQEVVTQITFKTPTAYKRRSQSFKTPTSVRKLGRQSTPGPGLNDLQRRLNDWLKKRGKPMSTFHHLKYFSRDKVITNDSEDKENEAENVEPQITDAIDMNPSQLVSIAKDALGDLNQLIIDSYPLALCETWLGTIRQRYKEIEEEPQYWECRASIEQTRGNISSAVECFKTAIIKGAEVKTIDNSLDKLLEKFSLLNIDTNISDDEKYRSSAMKDARNVFKSSIIQFAIQERKIKKDQGNAHEYIVTPVRRSARLSMSCAQRSPAVKICNSFNEIDESIRGSMKFHGNSYLN